MTNTPQKQERLFEVAPRYRCETAGATRVAFGAAAEEIVCAALGLDRIKINGQCDVNFDAEQDGTFYEIKSLSGSGKIVAYDWRLKKESRFSNLMYAILIHDAKGARENLLYAMAEGSRILVCDASLIRTLAIGLPLHIPKKKPEHTKRFGYTREGYAEGYRNVSIKSILSYAKTVREISFELYGVPCATKLMIVGDEWGGGH